MGSINSQHFLESVFSFLQEENLSLKHNFKQLTTWNSLNAMIIQHNIEKHYGVILSNHDFEVCTNIEQLYNKVIEYAQKP